jgi:hypothetical protein
MKVTLRDVAVLVSAIVVVLMLGWGIGLHRAVSAHIQLVEELTKLVQQSQQQVQPAVPSQVPEVPKE